MLFVNLIELNQIYLKPSGDFIKSNKNVFE